MIAGPKTPELALRLREARISSPRGGIDCGDWEVAIGEAWFVAGGVGAGKTSFLRSMAGLAQPLSGRIERFGDDWAGFSESETSQRRRRIGVVLCREAGLFHRFSVLDNIRLPLRYHGGRTFEEMDERARLLLAALDLERHAHVPSIRVSPAVARRTLLARALALGPELLLLDDPCAGLEPWDRRRLIHFVAQLRAGHELNQGRSLAIVVTGGSPADWREFPALRWACLRDQTLTPIGGWEQLVATAPELLHADGIEAAAD